MIDWDTELKIEPPFLTSLSDEKVLGILEKPLSVSKWPNHTQSVERGIRFMTETCTEWQATKQEMVTPRSSLAVNRLYLHLEPRSNNNNNNSKKKQIYKSLKHINHKR